MVELKQWFPVIITIITNAVIITIAFMSLKSDVKILSEKMNEADKKIEEIKSNHLAHLSFDIKELSEKFTNHLINHNKEQ